MGRYRHKLTDAESTEQLNELGGGILADDMGMGKSLSTLALVTTTLEQAHSWSQDAIVNSLKCRSRATLVIVPSTRKNNCTFVHSDKGRVRN